MRTSNLSNLFCARSIEKHSRETIFRYRDLFCTSTLLFVVAGCTQNSDVTLSSPWAMQNLAIELNIQNPFRERARLVGCKVGCSCLIVKAPEYRFNAGENKSCRLNLDASAVPVQAQNGGEVKVVPLFETQAQPPTKLSGRAFIVKFGPMRAPIEIQPRVVHVTQRSASAGFTVKVLCPRSVLSINSPESVRVSCLSYDGLDGSKMYDCEVTSKSDEFLALSGDFALEAVVTTHQHNSASSRIEFKMLDPVRPILVGEIVVRKKQPGKTFLILKVNENALPKHISVAKITGSDGIYAVCLPEREADQLVFRFSLSDGQVIDKSSLFVDAEFSTGGLSAGSDVPAKRRCLFCKSSQGEWK